MTKTAATMGWRRGLAFGAALLVVSGVARSAHADGDIEKAISISGSIGSEVNNTIHDARNSATSNGGGTMTGVMGLASVGSVAFGLGAELSPSVDGIGNRTFGGLAGLRLPISPRLRLLALGEVGRRTFFDQDDFLFDATVTPSEASLPYVGGRVGLTWLVLTHLDLGIMAFARTDVGERTMTVSGSDLLGQPTATTHQVGGFAGGGVLYIGFRFDTTRPLNDPPPRPPTFRPN